MCSKIDQRTVKLFVGMNLTRPVPFLSEVSYSDHICRFSKFFQNVFMIKIVNITFIKLIHK